MLADLEIDGKLVSKADGGHRPKAIREIPDQWRTIPPNFGGLQEVWR